jgi:acyl-coenzyme A synthetase/AMP-(fatty) acid ligase
MTVHTVEVEAMLRSHPAVLEAAVFTDSADRVVAVVTPVGTVAHGDHLRQLLSTYCRDELTAPMRPRRIAFANEVTA